MNKMKHMKPDPNSRYKQGYYKLINKSKYPNNDPIIYRSGLELKFCQYCDSNDKILSWLSEPIAIKYVNPVSGTVRNYYPDYVIKIKANNRIGFSILMIEVKSSNMIVPPKKPSKFASAKQKNSYKRQVGAVLTNISKFKSAEAFCKSKGWKYMFLTENFFKR